MRKTKKIVFGVFMCLLFIIEWTVDTVGQMWGAFHAGVKDLAIAVAKIYDETKINKGEPDSRKE